MSDSVRPHRRQPTRLCRPWDSLGKNTGVGCHCLLQPIYCEPMGSEDTQNVVPASLSMELFLARILAWVDIPFERSSQPRDWTQVSFITGGFFTIWAIYISFYFKLIYFNWRIITLQYFDDFCHASAWISYSYTCVPSILSPILSPSPSYPSRLSQNTGFGCLASYIKLTLVIYFTYGNV